jgi:hypothetical protein
MVHFLGVPLGGRLVLHTSLEMADCIKQILSAPPTNRLINTRWSGTKKYSNAADTFSSLFQIRVNPKGVRERERACSRIELYSERKTSK